MRFNPDNFLYMLKNIVTGKNGGPQNNLQAQAADGGIKVDRDARYVAATGGVTDSTTGTPAAALVDVTAAFDQAILNANFATIARALNSSASGGAVIAAGAAAAAGSVRFLVPRDYDEATDELLLYVFISTANADAGITLTGTPTVRPMGAAPVVGSVRTATLPFGTTAAPLSQVEQPLVISLSGLGLHRYDIVTVALALAGTTTGVTTVFATQFTFASTVVSFNETDATGIGSAYKGNPLR